MNIINPIEVKYQNSQGTSRVELIDILKLIEKDNQQLIWLILDLQAVGDISTIWERGIVDLEETIKHLPHGFILSWQMLTNLAQKFDDLIDIVIVGCHEVDRIPTLCLDADIYRSSEIVLELIDSSVWQIYTKDERLLQNLDRKFNQERIVAFNAR
jgi:hypothetical protein